MYSEKCVRVCARASYQLGSFCVTNRMAVQMCGSTTVSFSSMLSSVAMAILLWNLVTSMAVCSRPQMTSNQAARTCAFSCRWNAQNFSLSSNVMLAGSALSRLSADIFAKYDA